MRAGRIGRKGWNMATEGNLVGEMVIQGAMLVRIWRQSVKCSWENGHRGCDVGENMATECEM